MVVGHAVFARYNHVNRKCKGIDLEPMQAFKELFDKNLKEVLVPYFIDRQEEISTRFFLSPADLYHIILQCDPELDFFKIRQSRKELVCTEKTEKRGVATLVNELRNRFVNHTDARGWPKSRKRNQCRFGLKYRISDFPAFYRNLPPSGLTIGAGESLRWIKPLEARVSNYGSNHCSKRIETVGLFQVTLKNGTSGRMGYIDQFDFSGRVRCVHLYADGKTESAEKYPEQLQEHRVFRTLMGQILLAELVPSLFQGLQNYLQQVESLQGEHPDQVSQEMTTDASRKIVSLLQRHPQRKDTDYRREAVGLVTGAPSESNRIREISL